LLLLWIGVAIDFLEQAVQNYEDGIETIKKQGGKVRRAFDPTRS
jgi:hypothetical protein